MFLPIIGALTVLNGIALLIAFRGIMKGSKGEVGEIKNSVMS